MIGRMHGRIVALSMILVASMGMSGAWAASPKKASAVKGAAKPSLLKGITGLAATDDLLARAVAVGGRWVVEEADGRRRPLTLDPKLQARARQLLASQEVPLGAIVAIEPATGRILAAAEWSSEEPTMRGFWLEAAFPAASVFKLVTGAALVEAGVTPNEEVCVHGGRRGISEALLVADPKRDTECLSLASAMGKSANVVFARLAKDHLEAERLAQWAWRFGYNRTIPFVMPVEVSQARVAVDPLGFARTAAGFGETSLSPLHGAMIAAAIAGGGAMLRPRLFEDEPEGEFSSIDAESARAVGAMMEQTIIQGTARDAFREHGRWALGEIGAAGKTGTLAGKDPFRDYSWFVGYAPLENPTIAVAVLVVNGEVWRVRAPYVARETLRAYLCP